MTPAQLPHRVDWAVLERAYAAVARASDSRMPEFVANRLAEGQAIAGFLSTELPSRPLKVLDLGSGNGGVGLGVANHPLYRVTAADVGLNRELRWLRRTAPVPFDHVLASGERLPFATGAFDVVLCLETIEHVRDAEAVGAEIMRVLRPGGFCMLTTPARLRHLLGPDPHFGVPGLLLLPDRLQEVVVTRVLRLVPASDYNVAHVYWYAGSLARLFPDRQVFQAVGAPRASRLWSVLQRFFWSRLLIFKRSEPSLDPPSQRPLPG